MPLRAALDEMGHARARRARAAATKRFNEGSDDSDDEEHDDEHGDGQNGRGDAAVAAPQHDEAELRVGSPLERCAAVLKVLQSRPDAYWFAEPVDLSQAEGYAEVIKSPMDYSTVAERLSAGSYADPLAFGADMRQIFINALVFNWDGANHCHLAARASLDAFERAMVVAFSPDPKLRAPKAPRKKKEGPLRHERTVDQHLALLSNFLVACGAEPGDDLLAGWHSYTDFRHTGTTAVSRAGAARGGRGGGGAGGGGRGRARGPSVPPPHPTMRRPAPGILSQPRPHAPHPPHAPHTPPHTPPHGLPPHAPHARLVRRARRTPTL